MDPENVPHKNRHDENVKQIGDGADRHENRPKNDGITNQQPILDAPTKPESLPDDRSVSDEPSLPDANNRVEEEVNRVSWPEIPTENAYDDAEIDLETERREFWEMMGYPPHLRTDMWEDEHAPPIGTAERQLLSTYAETPLDLPLSLREKIRYLIFRHDTWRVALGVALKEKGGGNFDTSR